MNRKLFSIGLACLIAPFFIPHFAHSQDSRPMVHLVYFRASDTALRPNVDTEIDALMKNVQRLYADEMERHGYGRKTFQIESDAHGNTIVHHVVGKFTYSHYIEIEDFAWAQESSEQLKFPKWRIIVYMIDSHDEEELPFGAGGHGGGNRFSGAAHIYVWSWWVIAHEIGHAFGLLHDFRDGRYIMSYGPGQSQLSSCAAEFLDVHRYFNSTVNSLNEWSELSIIEMLPPSLVSPPNTIRLRFSVTDSDGLKLAHLHARVYDRIASPITLIDCKALNDRTIITVEFDTNALTPKNESVILRVFDVHGQVTDKAFPIDIPSLLPPAKVISIPDINLATAVQKEIGNITTHSILNLYNLNASNSEITDLTGLEHAHNLRKLSLTGNNISDVSVLSGLTNLNWLSLNNNDISDISALSTLTNLILLDLSSNNITDISPLKPLSKLTSLNLFGNSISDLTPLTSLKQLIYLDLRLNGTISDISPLVGLNLIGTERDKTGLRLEANPLNHESIHTHIPVMQAGGIVVTFDNITHPEFLKISGDK